jgi:hypothetical protein
VPRPWLVRSCRGAAGARGEAASGTPTLPPGAPAARRRWVFGRPMTEQDPNGWGHWLVRDDGRVIPDADVQRARLSVHLHWPVRRKRLQQGSGVHPRAQQAWSYRIDGGRAPSLLGRRHDARDPDAAADGRYGHFLAGHPDQQWKALGGERGEGFGRCDRVRPGRSGEWIRSSKNLQRSRTAPCSRRYW